MMDRIKIQCSESFSKIAADRNYVPEYSQMSWEYFSDITWISMDFGTCYLLEKHLFENDTRFALKISQYTYSFDLTLKTQKNLETNKIRKIRRKRLFSSFVRVRNSISEAPGSFLNENWSKLWIPVNNKDHPQEKCPFCLDSFESNQLKEMGRLSNCRKHYFHLRCETGMSIFDYVREHKKCPVCKKFYGFQKGTRPYGEMFIKRFSAKVSGFECEDAWEIKFHFPSGHQTSQHPNPGKYYQGEIRWAYLPNTAKGRTILCLFIKAWQRSFLFTIGYSLSRGENDVIIYDGIHMKSTLNNTAYGFPDEGYLDRVESELRERGIIG